MTEAEVRALLRVVEASTTVAPEVAAASALVEAHLGGAGLTESILKQIELYVAAHLVSIGIPQARLSSLRADGIEERYAGGVAGEGLAGTAWGQQAIALDTTGRLAAAAKAGRRTAELRVL